MENNDLLLERIAVALEKIANSLERKEESTVTEIHDGSGTNNFISDTDKEYEKNDIGVKELIEELAFNNIIVKNYPEREDEQKELDNLSYFMGDRFSDIKIVYERIKRNLNFGTGFSLNIKNWSQTSISSSCQLCTMLYNIAYLSEYKYLKSPKFLLNARPNTIPSAINFLTGHWLEYFVKFTMLKIIDKLPYKVDYSYIINPQIILPNGDDFELDVVFVINGALYWIEAKTGPYQNFIDKYSKIAKMMNVMSERMYLVLTEVPSMETKKILEKTFGINIIYVEDFEQEMTEVLSNFMIDDKTLLCTNENLLLE